MGKHQCVWGAGPGEGGGVMGREPAYAYRSMQQDRSAPAYIPRRVQHDCMVREVEWEWEVCGERGLGGGAGKKAREEGRARRSISAFVVQLLVFELKILEIFESEIRQNILDYQWMLENCHNCSS